MFDLDCASYGDLACELVDVAQSDLAYLDQLLLDSLTPWQIILLSVIAYVLLTWIYRELYSLWMGDDDAIHHRVVKGTFALVRSIPFVRNKIKKELGGILHELSSGSMMKIPATKHSYSSLPPHPIDRATIISEIEAMAQLSKFEDRIKGFKV